MERRFIVIEDYGDTTIEEIAKALESIEEVVVMRDSTQYVEHLERFLQHTTEEVAHYMAEALDMLELEHCPEDWAERFEGPPQEPGATELLSMELETVRGELEEARKEISKLRGEQ